MTLYSLNGNYPAPLPFRIRLPNGLTRTDPSTFRPQDIASAGYVQVGPQPYVNSSQTVEWNPQTVSWVVRDKTAEELQADSEARRLLVDEERNRRIANGFLFQNNMFDSRPEDQKRISAATQLAFMATLNGAQSGDIMWAGSEPFAWISKDNSIVTMDAPTVIEFGKTAAEWERSHIFAARALKDMVLIPEDYQDDIWWPSATVGSP